MLFVYHVVKIQLTINDFSCHVILYLGISCPCKCGEHKNISDIYSMMKVNIDRDRQQIRIREQIKYKQKPQENIGQWN